MKRSGFLKRGAALVGGVMVARRLPDMPVYGAEAAADALPASIVGLGSGDALVGSGGLCAPLSTYYQMAPQSPRSPVLDLPAFTASRGGISFERGAPSAGRSTPTPAWDDDVYDDWDDLEGLGD